MIRPRGRAQRAQDEAAIAGLEAGREQRRPPGRARDRLPVDLRDQQLAHPPIGHESPERDAGRPGRRLARRPPGTTGAIGRRARGRTPDGRRPGSRTPRRPAGTVADRPPTGAARRAPRRRDWPGSAAASRWTRPGSESSSRFAHGAQPVEGPGLGELGGAQAIDEVAPADPAGLLERSQHRVDPGEPAGGPLAHHGLAGEHAVAVEQGQGQGVEPLGRRRRPARRGLRRLRPATTDLRPRADRARQAAGTLARRPARAGASAAPGAGRTCRSSPRRPRRDPTGRRGRSGPGRRRRPRGSAGRTTPRAARGARGSRRGRGPDGRSSAGDPPARIEQGVAQDVPARAGPGRPGRRRGRGCPGSDPGDLAHRPELVEQARLVAGQPGGQDVALEDRGRDRQAGQLVDHLGQPFEGGLAAEDRPRRRRLVAQPGQRRDPCQSGRNRARAIGSTGSTSCRSRASDRRRSWRRTSGSHHSRSRRPAGTRPAGGARWPSAAEGVLDQRRRAAPSGVAGSPSGTARGSGPSARGGPRGRRTGSRNAWGTPAGDWTPIASR